nr:ribonuclease H-like domain-containing protein [Tanacetum cinerariifolium]GFA06321.1 ribonuclease H-like domain-containing protein [Tanacetum cinerariifolium]
EDVILDEVDAEKDAKVAEENADVQGRQEESKDPQVMQIEQYFLMTDYSLWEVILNGDSPIPTSVIDGVIQHVAHTTAEQRLARKNELKARGILLMALPDKHLLKFNIHKDARTLMEAIKKSFCGNKETKKVQKALLKQQYENFTGLSSKSLDQIHDRLQKLISQLEILGESLSQEDINLNLKIYEAKVKSSSSTSPTTQNIAFVSSQNTDTTNESVSVVVSVFVASLKVSVSALPNVDTLSNVMAMRTIRARRFLQRTGRNIEANETTSLGFDVSKVECYNCHRKGNFAREYRSPKDIRRNVPVEAQRRNVPLETSTSNALVSQYDGVGSYDWSFQAEEEPTNYALMAFISSSSSNSDNELRDNALVDLRKEFEKAEQERDELKLKLENFQTSSKNLIYDRYQSGKGYHAVLSPYTGTFVPPKPDLVFYDASTVNETVPTTFNVELSHSKPDKDLSQSNRPSAPLIEDWVSNSEDDSGVEYPIPADHLRKDRPKSRGYEKKMVQTPVRNHAQRGNHQHYARMTHPNPQRHVVSTTVLTRSRLVLHTAARPVTTAIPHHNVTRPRPAKIVGNKPHSPPRRAINLRPSPPASNFPQKVTTVKASKVNVVKGVKGN